MIVSMTERNKRNRQRELLSQVEGQPVRVTFDAVLDSVKALHWTDDSRDRHMDLCSTTLPSGSRIDALSVGEDAPPPPSIVEDLRSATAMIEERGFSARELLGKPLSFPDLLAEAMRFPLDVRMFTGKTLPEEKPPAPTPDHELKVVAPYFDALADGSKPFEVRLNDRAFQKGDLLKLREWDDPDDWPAAADGPISPDEGYTGRELLAEVTFVYSGDPRFGDWPSGVVVLGLAVQS